MAIQKVIRRTCDRCSKPIAEDQVVADAAPNGHSEKTAEEMTPALFIAGTLLDNEGCLIEAKQLHFEDLCDKCEKRVLDIVNSLILGREDDKRKTSGDTAEAKEPGAKAARA